MSRDIHSVTVFCGSNPGRDPAYRASAEALGRCLLERGIRLVYGGGNVGLMGILADTVMAGGGEVIGVIPQSLVDREVAHHTITRLEVVEDMHVRKHRMYDLADAFVAMPGGVGTLDELMETLTWLQLGFHTRPKPCGVLDVGGYYAPLLTQLDRAAEEGFLRPGHRDLLLSAPDPDVLLDRFAEHRPPQEEKWL